MKIAIIGSGISGLTCAYLLHKKHEVTIFEKNDYIGGHTHTHEIEYNDKLWNIDSGFIVYNERTYPNFIKILDQLGVNRQLTRMGFSVKSEKHNLEYAGHSLDGLFAQRSNFFRPSFIRMLRSMLRFNSEARVDLKTKKTILFHDPEKTNKKSIEKIVSELGYQANNLKANPDSYADLPACCKIGGMDKM